MRKFKHLTPEYVFNRLCSFYYEKKYPLNPWLTRQANELLDFYLKKSHTALEFGSGRSTPWIAKRVAKLTSIEHNELWAKKVRKLLEEQAIKNVDYIFIAEDYLVKNEDSDKNIKYVQVIDSIENESLDFCLVDGIHRGLCTLKVINKIKQGGLLVLDNANLYLPSNSNSPNSRSLKDGANGEIWQEVEDRLSSEKWKQVWTSSGVGDTALFLKN